VSGFLSTAELADMQGVSDSALPGVCVIQSLSFTSDGMGGGTAGYTASGTVDCRIAPGGLSPAERVFGEQLTPVGDYVATMPAGTIVPHSGRITSGGRTFEVLDAKHRDEEIALRVALREIS
jgi:hypothetical protein